MTSAGSPRPTAPPSGALAVLSTRPRPEELEVLRALARRLREASSRFSVLLLNDAVYLAEDPSDEREDAPIDWILLEEDSRGRGVQATHPVREVGYAEAVRLLFGAERVFQFP